jgi:hypothetical protein
MSDGVVRVEMMGPTSLLLLARSLAVIETRLLTRSITDENVIIMCSVPYHEQ